MSAKFRSPQFLQGHDPVFRVRCPIHGFIHFTKAERTVIDHQLFQRLRYIRQLALTELAYPGATHTRFEHSLGVMEVATRAFDSLASKNGELMEATFKTVESYEDKPMAKARQTLRLAALLHDVGHAAFSHAVEEVVQGEVGHEELSVMAITERKYLGEQIDKDFWSTCSKYVGAIVDKKSKGLPPQFQILKDIVSGQMDADRSDYLVRDSYYCGVEYGKFDFRRMIECLEVFEREPGSRVLEIALNYDGVHTFEALILARYQMNVQVYFHRLRRIYDLYLTNYHHAIMSEVKFTPEFVLANNDITMMARIFKDAEGSSGEPSRWAKLIRSRRHFPQVFTTGVNADAGAERKLKELKTTLERDFAGVEFYIDDTDPVNIHKLFVKGDQDQNLIEIFLVGPGKRELITEKSQILGKIPKAFRQGIIFAGVDRNDSALVNKIRESATQRWRESGGS